MAFLQFFAAMLLCVAAPGVWCGQPSKVLRVAFPVAEDGFDPARISDGYSATVAIHIYESLYAYDYLAIPVEIRPLTAAAMPEHSTDFRTWTIHLRPGIYFTPDPALKGQRRELVAADYVYSFKRFADPAINSPHWADFDELKIKGLANLRKEALDGKRAFDYDREIEGLRALDRYTLQFRLEVDRPRLVQKLVGAFKGAVAREVVEAYGTRIMEHPVGTGPFKLGQWRRSSLIVLERNPDYREVLFDAKPGPNDITGQAIAARLRGRRLPMVDRVEISIITENQPRWLTFVDGQIDTVEVPSDFLRLALPGGKVAPYLERRGIQGYVVVSHAVSYYYFNMEDPIVGGYTAEKIALRRAIGLGMNVERSIALARGGQGLVAQSPIAAHVRGFDAGFRSENGEYDSARAKALLDTYGYLDRDNDGWRERPNGQPLVLSLATDPSQISRQMDAIFQKDMGAIGLKVHFKVAQWQENAKASRAGKLMMWQLGNYVVAPDGTDSLLRFYGPAAGGFNQSRFKLPAMDALYESILLMPDGPERDKLFDQAKRIAVAYMPEKTTVHRVFSYMNHPWVIGYRIKPFVPGWYHMVDLDLRLAPSR
jgi:ABC-type transport system substrate-binding protein